MKAQTKETQQSLTPAKAKELLIEGNKRFVNNNMTKRDLLQQVKETANGQHPFAVVVSCIDSRTSTELIFDQGIGDVFNARIAGNILNEDILGSMEFACKVAGSKLVAIVGHTKCGAIKGACDNAQLGNLTALLSKIRPAVDSVKLDKGERNSSNSEFVEKVAENNVKLMMRQVREKSQVLREMHDAGEIAIVGGMYNIETGVVEFYSDEPANS